MGVRAAGLRHGRPGIPARLRGLRRDGTASGPRSSPTGDQTSKAWRSGAGSPSSARSPREPHCSPACRPFNVKTIVIGGDDNSDDPLKGPWEDETQEWRPCGSGHHFDLAFPGLFGAKFAEDGCADLFGGDGEAKIAAASQAALAYRFGKTKGTAA